MPADRFLLLLALIMRVLLMARKAEVPGLPVVEVVELLFAELQKMVLDKVAMEVVLQVVQIMVAAEAGLRGTRGLAVAGLEEAAEAVVVPVQPLLLPVEAEAVVVWRASLRQGVAALDYLALAVVVLAARAMLQPAQQFVAVMVRAVHATALPAIKVIFMEEAQVHYLVV